MLNRRIALSLLAQLALLWSTGSVSVNASAALRPPGGGGGPNNAVGTAITYQGRLTQGNSGVTANCDLAFRLYDTVSNGALMANPITTTVPVTGGLFTVALDFGDQAFTGDARFLETRVRCPAGSGSFTTLSPRQTLTAAPYALTLRSGAVISGTADTTLTINNYQTDGGVPLEVFGIDDGMIAETSGTFGTAVSAQASGTSGTGISTSGPFLGLYAFSADGTAVDVYSPNGTALSVEGSARQSRAAGGLMKALVLSYGGAITRCFNGQTSPPTTAAPCGFSLASSTGTYTVTLGFQVDDRFFSVTPFFESTTAVFASVKAVGSNYVVVKTWDSAGSPVSSAFFLEVY
jgi:hypothetical protein